MPFCCVRWTGFAVPWPLWDRDFLYVEYGDRIKRGDRTVFCSVCRSVELESCPKLEQSPYKFVRARLDPSGYVWRDLPDGSGVDLAYVVQVDACGNVPVWVQVLHEQPAAPNRSIHCVSP